MSITYETHDNGGHPYKVVVDYANKQLSMFLCKITERPDHKTGTVVSHRTDKKGVEQTHTHYYDPDPIVSYDELALQTSFLLVFVGKSPLCAMTEYSGGHGPKFDGNSLLVEVAKQEYMFIGDCIYRFSTKELNDEIVAYDSPVGNNDVPYPVAIGRTHFYLMLGCISVAKKLIEPLGSEPDMPYTVMYDHDKIYSHLKPCFKKLEVVTIAKRKTDFRA
jgi:hypothetical protein